MRRLRPPRRLGFAREGKYFVAITIAIGFGAINTGNNLLYLLLGWMISVIIASGVLSELSLRGLHVSRKAPSRVFAGRPFLMQISLRNCKGRLPSFSLEIEDLMEDRPLVSGCRFLKVSAQECQTSTYEHTAARRGLYQLQGFRVSTRFPFALFRKSRDLEVPGELLVFPALHAVPQRPREAPQHGDQARARLGRRGEIFGLREWREGDERRDVHWPSTARRGRLVVREYQDEAQRLTVIFVDNGVPHEPDSAELDGFERAVSLAASLAAQAIARHQTVRLIARGLAVSAGRGPAHLDRILSTLAVIELGHTDEAFAGLSQAGADNLLVRVRSSAGAATPPGMSRVLEMD